METVILWTALIIAVGFLLFSLKKLPLKDWLVVFLFASYIAVLGGTVVVEEGMLAYPVKILKHFDSSIQFEMITLPVICLYFYLTTIRSNITEIILKGLLYTSGVTIIEFILEKNTDVIEYYTWSWLNTFISVFIFLLFVRSFIQFINKRS